VSLSNNLGHTPFVPLALFGLETLLQQRALLAVATFWFAHIAFDRLLGYGLKHPAHFKDTHLQHLP